MRARHRIELFKDSSKAWRFRIIARNGQIVAQSEGYRRRVDALSTARSLARWHWRSWPVTE